MRGNPDMSVEIAGIEMKNPVMVASGTFGREYAELVDFNGFGAVVVKGVSWRPRNGNPTPRICETPSGMLNAIGLQNKGVDYFIEKELPFFRHYDTPIIVNVFGANAGDYGVACQKLEQASGIAALEINVSCPNVRCGGMAVGTNPALTEEVMSVCRSATALPLIAKLTPNVTDITEIARAAVAGGADALSLINTLLGMSVDVEARRPRLANIVGGLSGPAIRPVAVRMVWQVAQAVDVPIIGMGGISDFRDALEFLMVGATAVAVGTATFARPETALDIVAGLEDWMVEHDVPRVADLVGSVVLEEGEGGDGIA